MINRLKQYEPGKKKKLENNKIQKKNSTVFIVYTFDKMKHKFDFTDWAILSNK